ncbi:two-component system sensor histidine kinase NblS [Synechococcus elongatus]|uniref:two-component system sensor histidine kinase NblS n=1 Tax=Synechococcus elongatus TaxID=32046 RepID=UPI000F7EC6CA|nr:ATP-binding protein [Synechococcus elongatus]
MLALWQQLRDTLTRWWADFTLQTKLMAIATLVVSLIMSGLTFWAVNSIQEDARLNDTRFGRDLGLLLAANATPLIADEDIAGLTRFSYRFYRSTSSVRYLLYADTEGEIYLGIPFSQSEVRNSLTIQRRIQLPPDYLRQGDRPYVRQHLTPAGLVTDVFVPLFQNDRYLGVLAIGTNPSPAVVASSGLTRDVTIAVFITIWVMVIVGAVFNALIITRPIRELVEGVRSIASGNFKQRIDLPPSGELGELIASFNDMAEQLEGYAAQNIDELTSEKAKLETLVSTIADGALLLDADLNLVLVNPAAIRIFGWEGRSLKGDDVIDHLPSPLAQELHDPLKAIANGDREAVELRLTLPERSNRTVRILVSNVLDTARANVKGIAVTVQDITREVELNEAKSQFISNVSHELRTPLFNIKSFIETLHDYGDDLSEEERREFLSTANHETDRLTRLVNDVLDLSRLESNRRYNFEGIDLVQPIEQTLRTYQLNAREKGIELRSEIARDLPAVRANYDLLLQVFANLVGNALKFTASDGCVAMRAYLVGQPLRTEAVNHSEIVSSLPNIRIEINDTGIGIDAEDQEAIFDRFFRVENRVHTLEGTGLGLSIVRNIVEKHQSRIHLISEVGIGTTFWFDLPIYQPEEVIAAPAKPEAITATNGTEVSVSTG